MAPQPVTLETLTTLIESTPPFDGLTPEMRQLLFEQALLVSYEADDIILAQGVIPAHPRYLFWSSLGQCSWLTSKVGDW